MQMSKKKKNTDETSKIFFLDLLNKATKPLDSSKERKRMSRTSGDYSDKRTRQRKAEDAED